MNEAWSSIERDRTSVSAGEVTLEAQLLWEGDVLAVVYAPMTNGRVLRVCDLGLPGADADLVVARNARGTSELVLPSGEALEAGYRLRLRVGTVSLRLALVARSLDKLPPPCGDGRLLRACSGVAFLHALLFTLAFLGRAGTGDAERASLVTLKSLTAALEDSDVASDEPPGASGAGTTGTPAPAALTAHTVRGATVTPSVRHEMREDATTFGMIQLLGSGPTAPVLFGEEGLDRAGSLWRSGSTLDALPGSGLSGTGEGGGGRGEGIALGGIGKLDHRYGENSGACGCDSSASASQGTIHTPSGSLRPHVVRGPTVVCGNVVAEGEVAHCVGVTVNGRLPQEAIQRVVRQNFGRFRACYEDGLVRNPSLEGRVEVKFVIDRAGSVASASASGFGDEGVSRCVARAYEAMSFPQPEGGIVTVVYPLVFSA